jgi:MFS family permease
MVYPLYETNWGVSTTTVTWIFAAYPLALIPVLLIFGGLSDQIGRRASMLFGLAAELIGVLLFAVATDVFWLLAGRALMGLGVGLSIGPASVAMVEFSAHGKEQRAGAITTAVSALGIALAMIVGGALTEYAPLPMRLNFIVLAAVIVVVGYLVFKMPRHVRTKAEKRWQVRLIKIPSGSRGFFLAGAMAFASSFLLGAIVLPLGAQIAHELADSTNALVTGVLLSVFAGCITLFSLFAQRLDVWLLVCWGAVGSIVAVWLFVLTGVVHSLAVFFLASAVAGGAYAFSFAGGLGVFNSHAAPQHRGSMVSGGYLAGYVVQGFGAPALGWAVTEKGLISGLYTGALSFGFFFMATLTAGIVVLTRRRRRGHTI